MSKINNIKKYQWWEKPQFKFTATIISLKKFGPTIKPLNTNDFNIYLIHI